MKKLTALILFTTTCSPIFADTIKRAEENIKSATPEMPVIIPQEKTTQDVSIVLERLKQDQSTTEELLNIAIARQDINLINQLLPIYQGFKQQDSILLQLAQALQAKLTGEYTKAISIYRNIIANHPEFNPIRLELAIALFEDQQNETAESLFRQVRSDENLPPLVQKQVDAYLKAIEQRNGWNISASAYYIRDKNIYKQSSSPTFDSVQLKGLKKKKEMLPQKAEGFGYAVNIGRDLNIKNSHYLTVENNLYGKLFWNEREADETTNRISLGYAYKDALQTFRISPFYELGWYSGKRHNKVSGARIDYRHWLNSQWQLSNALEYGKNRYILNKELNGSTVFLSSTLFWQQNPRQFFYAGVDVNNTTADEKSKGFLTKSLRLGWGRVWSWGISSRLHLSFSEMKYKDEAKYSYLSLGKTRKDRIYYTGLTLWKQDWHLWNITPKLQLTWRKRKSNLPDLYSYQEKNVNVIFEKTF
ncbi:TPR repeat-containing protein precursor [Haemophilus influenzae]|uniref:porin family protein n=1 Tax=Haemophilus influenzae TaxID=727 RepID=UPI000D0151BE|nr:porin family protein [Haemophilus influenzae]PRJ89144.1 TPR repeat-containing protein precursor [Haemophilus influenzae]PRK61553.1 TPR repeat-containing protein precursor [Haemophilus influenzae]PRM07951.1 TPR repeat-containing protein precursor [Haemophilus influenzae]